MSTQQNQQETPQQIPQDNSHQIPQETPQRSRRGNGTGSLMGMVYTFMVFTIGILGIVVANVFYETFIYDPDNDQCNDTGCTSQPPCCRHWLF